MIIPSSLGFDSRSGTMSSSVFANAVIEYGSFDSLYSEYYKMSWFAALTIGVIESALDDRSVVAEIRTVAR